MQISDPMEIVIKKKFLTGLSYLFGALLFFVLNIIAAIEFLITSFINRPNNHDFSQSETDLDVNDLKAEKFNSVDIWLGSLPDILNQEFCYYIPATVPASSKSVLLEFSIHSEETNIIEERDYSLIYNSSGQEDFFLFLSEFRNIKDNCVNVQRFWIRYPDRGIFKIKLNNKNGNKRGQKVDCLVRVAAYK